MKTKVCSSCGENKSLEEFHKDRNRPDGRRSACKQCRSLNHSKVERAKLPPPPPPPETEEEKRLLARQRAIKDVVENHWTEFNHRYAHHLDVLKIQERWHSIK